MSKQKSKYAHGKHPNSLNNLKGRWKPGQSGNPKGRPKGVKYVSEALRDLLASDKGLADKLAKKLANRALKNSYDLNLLFERTEGKVTLPIGGDPNMPIITEIVAHVTEDKNGSNDSSKKSDS
jgi:hypothetical protein